MKTASGFITHITLLAVAASALLSCTGNRGAEALLQRAEDIMNERPDSALMILRNMDEGGLRTKGLKARHALLLSQALDKNYIDLQSDSIISKAVRFYEKTTDHESLFKSYYYLGRVHFNAGNYNDAMQTYLKAEELTDRTDDDFAKALLYAQIGSLYRTYYNNTRSLEFFERAYEHYEMAGMESHKIYTKISMGPIYNDIGEYEKGLSMIREALQWGHDNGRHDVCDECFDILFLMSMTKDKPELIDECIRGYGVDCLPSSFWVNLGLGYRYGTEGDDTSCRELMEKAWNLAESSNDSISVLFAEYKLLAGKGDYRNALQKHEAILQMEEASLKRTLTAPLQDAYVAFLDIKSSEQQAIIRNKELTVKVTILLCIVILLSVGIVIIVIRNRMMARRARTMDVINRRLGVLDKVVISHISDRASDARKANQEIEDLIADRDAFMRTTRLTLEERNSDFIAYLKDKGLSEKEIDFCCLYAIGMKGTDIKNYTSFNSLYKDSSEVRRKLGMAENDTNLSIFLQDLLKMKIVK